VLAAEYSDAALLATHRLSVDAYAVQHTGDGSRQAIKSVGLHLARLMLQLEAPRPAKPTNDIMLKLGQHKARLKALTPPEKFSMTITEVTPHVGTARHVQMVQAWAQSAWNDWHQQHDFIRK